MWGWNWIVSVFEIFSWNQLAVQLHHKTSHFDSDFRNWFMITVWSISKVLVWRNFCHKCESSWKFSNCIEITTALEDEINFLE